MPSLHNQRNTICSKQPEISMNFQLSITIALPGIFDDTEVTSGKVVGVSKNR